MKKRLFLGGVLLLPILLFCKTIPFQQGWPVFVNGPKTSPIKIADIDNDGKKEIIFGDRSYIGQEDWWLYIKNYRGEDMSGWPKNHAGSDTYPAIFDFNDDGKLEILKTYSGVHMWDSEGNNIWSIPYDGDIFQSTYLPYQISVDDLDNDGIKEIIVTCYWGGAVFVFEPDGSVRDGWPVLGTNLVNTVSASLGDIDNDGLKEIIFPADKLYCFKADGTMCPNFPISVDFGIRCKISLADIDNDGYLEIIFGDLTNNIRVMRYDGTLYPGYPINGFRMEYVSIGDINLNGSYDFTFSRGNAPGGIYSYEILSASLLPNFPIPMITDGDGKWGYSSPELVDLSDDFGEEIVAGAGNGGLVSDGKLFAFNLNGEIVEGFPSELLYHRALSTGCSVDDLDDDGDVEICCGSENGEFVVPAHSNVFCWDSPQPWNRDLADWMMDGFDLQNTGRWRRLYHIDKINSHLTFEGCSTNPCFLPPDGSLYAVTITAKRKFAGEYPSGQDVRLSRTLGCGEYEGPVIDNQDGTYTRFFRAPTKECMSNIEGWVNEFKLNDKLNIFFGSEFGMCDGNQTRCDITDVQKAVNKNLGIEPCSPCADCELDGICSITDVQKIVNCNLGFQVACH